MSEQTSAVSAPAQPSVPSPEPVEHERFAAAVLDPLGEPPDSVCRAHQLESGLELGGCKILGPYPGTIVGEQGTSSEDHEAALEACLAEPRCVGVSSDWYTGSPWYPVLEATTFASDSDSYGCTLVLDCRG